MPEFSKPLNLGIRRNKNKDAALLPRFASGVTDNAYAFYTVYTDLNYDISVDMDDFLSMEDADEFCIKHFTACSTPLFSGIVADIRGEARLCFAYVDEHRRLAHLSCPIKSPPLWKRKNTSEGIEYISICFDEAFNGQLEIVFVNYGGGVEDARILGNINIFTYIASRATLDVIENGIIEFYQACYAENAGSVIDEALGWMNNILGKAEQSQFEIDSVKRPRSWMEYSRGVSTKRGLRKRRREYKRYLEEYEDEILQKRHEFSLERLNLAERFRQLEEAKKANLKRYACNKIREAQRIACKELDSMDAVEFERLVAGIFQRLGYRTVTANGNGVEGIDIVVSKGKREYCAKFIRHPTPIGQQVVRDFYGAMNDTGVSKGFIISSGIFSLAAESFAEGKPIELVDGELLLELIRGVNAAGRA